MKGTRQGQGRDKTGTGQGQDRDKEKTGQDWDRTGTGVGNDRWIREWGVGGEGTWIKAFKGLKKFSGWWWMVSSFFSLCQSVYIRGMGRGAQQ